MSEANKLGPLGIGYMVRRSTLVDANTLRNSEFFEKVYYTLYRKYKGVLTDRRSRYTSTATHDHVMLKVIELPKGSFLAIDRAYINYEASDRMTASGTYYVTKMKKNLTYKVEESRFIMDNQSLATYHESIVEFNKDEIRHKVRLVEY